MKQDETKECPDCHVALENVTKLFFQDFFIQLNGKTKEDQRKYSCYECSVCGAFLTYRQKE